MGWGHEGRITVADEESSDVPFPPKYAYLILQSGDYKAAFCDPRKFGKTELRTDSEPLSALAPDAWHGEAQPIIESITSKSLGIKALLLDQKRACAGVGKWVADEVLYQCHMHPDQSYLTTEEATNLVQTLQSILGTAVDCLAKHVPYPSDWLFPYRWTKKKAGKDGLGRSITFVQSGGRTTAIIASEQKLYKRKQPTKSSNAPEQKVKQTSRKRVKEETEVVAVTVKSNDNDVAKYVSEESEISFTSTSNRRSKRSRVKEEKVEPTPEPRVPHTTTKRNRSKVTKPFNTGDESAKTNRSKVKKPSDKIDETTKRNRSKATKLPSTGEEISSRRRSPRFVSP